MAQIRKLAVETEIQSSADKFYYKFRNNMTELTKVHPEIYKSIEVLKGNGIAVGSVTLWKNAIGKNLHTTFTGSCSLSTEEEKSRVSNKRQVLPCSSCDRPRILIFPCRGREHDT